MGLQLSATSEVGEDCGEGSLCAVNLVPDKALRRFDRSCNKGSIPRRGAAKGILDGALKRRPLREEQSNVSGLPSAEPVRKKEGGGSRATCRGSHPWGKVLKCTHSRLRGIFLVDVGNLAGPVAAVSRRFGLPAYTLQNSTGSHASLHSKKTVSLLKRDILKGRCVTGMFSLACDDAEELRPMLKLIKALHKRRCPWILNMPVKNPRWLDSELVELSYDSHVKKYFVDSCFYRPGHFCRSMYLAGHIDSRLESRLEHVCQSRRGGICEFNGQRHVQQKGFPPRQAEDLGYILSTEIRRRKQSLEWESRYGA